MQVLEVISSFFYTPYWIDATHAYTKINGIKKTCVSVLFYNMVVNIPKVMAYQLKVHNYFLYCDAKIYAYVCAINGSL